MAIQKSPDSMTAALPLYSCQGTFQSPYGIVVVTRPRTARGCSPSRSLIRAIFQKVILLLSYGTSFLFHLFEGDSHR